MEQITELNCDLLFYNNQPLNGITCAGFVLKTLDDEIILVKTEGKCSFPQVIN